MSIVYLEDLNDAIEIAIHFELFVKFKEKFAIFNPLQSSNDQNMLIKDERAPIYEVKGLQVATALFLKGTALKLKNLMFLLP